MVGAYVSEKDQNSPAKKFNHGLTKTGDSAMQIYGTIALRKAFYSSPDWFRARHKALVRDRFRCVHCDADLKPKGVSRVNHKKPLAQCNKQEATNLANLESVCASCHGRISARDDVNPFRGSSATGGSNDPNDDWFDY